MELELFEGNTSDIEKRDLEGKLDIELVGLISKYSFNNLRAEKFMTRKSIATSLYVDIALKIEPYVLTGFIVPIPIEEKLMVLDSQQNPALSLK